MNECRHVEQARKSCYWLKTVPGLVLSIALLAWILRRCDLGEVWSTLRVVPLWPVLATICIGYLAIPLRVVQWRWLLGNPPEARFMSLLKAICVGHLGNCFLPMRGGELVRTYLLSRSSSLPMARVLASVVLTRLQDILPILVLLAVLLAVIPLDEGTTLDAQELLDQPVFISKARLGSAIRILAIGAAGAAIGVVLFYRWQEALRKCVVRVLNPVSSRFARWLDTALSQVGEAIQVVRNPRLFWGAQGLSFVCWLLFIIAPVPLLMAFSLSFEQACLTALAVTTLTTFAYLIPTPGAVGSFHALCLVALLVCNPSMDRNAAVAFTLLAHLIATVSPAIPGLLFLQQVWRDVWRLREGG